MGPFEMVVAIVLIVVIAGVVKARHKAAHGSVDNEQIGASADAARTRDELKALRERVAVLERIATENQGRLDLDREIERLRGPQLEKER